MPFPATFGSTYIHLESMDGGDLGFLPGVVVVYKTGNLAVTGSKHVLRFFIFVLFNFCFLYYLVSF